MTEFHCPNCSELLIVSRASEPEPDWIRHEDGWGWRYDGRRIIAEHPPQESANLSFEEWPTGGYLYRTSGSPKTMTTLWMDWELEIEESCADFNLEPERVCALIGIEATRLPDDSFRFNPRCYREEDGYVSDSETPNKISPGLMQTLMSTAQHQVDAGRVPWLSGHGLTREDLFVPRISISTGASYMMYQLDRYGDDIKAFVAAYNAGSLFTSDESPWRMRTHSPVRVDLYIAWNNDAVEVI